jgi:phosphoglycerate kinase
MMLQNIKGIPQAALRGKSVLVRIDSGRSLSDNPMVDYSRVDASLDTLSYLMKAGARVVVVTHTGLFDKAQEKAMRLDEVVRHLSSRLRAPIWTLEGWDAGAVKREVSRIRDGEVLLLENLSRMPGEEANAAEFARLLASLCDFYCNDAFALAHELRASTVGVAHQARRPVAGLAFERELSLLSQTLDDPDRPLLSILGGELSEDKLAMVEIIARQSQVLLLGGELCLPFLIAQGRTEGRVEVNRDMVRFAESILSEAKKEKREIDMPIDFITVSGNELKQIRKGRRFATGPDVSNIPAGEMRRDQVICDIGETTRWAWSGRFGFARTIFWHGPLGISEIEPFDEGTRFIAEELTRRTWPGIHKVVVAGSSLTTTLRRMGHITERLPGLSSADRAALHYFAKRPLPAVDALRQSAGKTAEPLRLLIPLAGLETDVNALRVGAEFGKRSAEITLLLVRPGFDEEQYPDFRAVMSEADRTGGQIESERIFTQAKATLASQGLTSSREVAAQGSWADIILRFAARSGANLIVLPANGASLVPGSHRVIEQALCDVIVAR